MSEITAAQEIEMLRQELKDAQQQINSLKISVRAEELRVKISSEYTNFGLWEYDIADDICYQYKKLNGRYENHLDPIVHFRDTIISWGSVYAEDLPEFNRFCDAMERGDKEVGCDVRVINDECDVVWFRYEGKTIYDDNGNPIKVIGRTLDVTAEKGGVDDKSDKRRDELTGAYMEEVFEEDIRVKTSGANRFKIAALLMVSIDNFSAITHLGQEFKDYVVKDVAKVLFSISVCEHDSSVGRVGDGEFAMFVRFNNMADLDSIAAKVVIMINTYEFYNNTKITVSEGVSIIKNGKKYRTAIKEAAAAMRSARAKGGNGFAHYNKAMAAEAIVNLPASSELLDDVRALKAGAAARVANAAEKVRRNFREDSDEAYALAVKSTPIYNLVAKAFIDKAQRGALIKEAICEVGRQTNFSAIFVYHFVDDEVVRTLPYSKDNKTADDSPGVRFTADKEILEQTLLNNDEIGLDIHMSNGRRLNFELVNGAKFAIIIPIMRDDYPIGYLAFISESRRTIQNSDAQLIALISGALSRMFTTHHAENQDADNLHFSSVVMNNLRIEEFSIVPETYEMDRVGEGTAAHYNVKRGDICYKALRGRETPCHDCPAKKLSKGQLTASTTYYCEEEHRWLDIAASADENSRGEKRYVISTADITDCLGKIQMVDTLTGIMTLDAFTAEGMRLTANGADGYFVLVINIAGFRRLNESMGYEFGNSLLIAVSDILERSVGAGELLCRSEGSRFVALLKNNSMTEMDTRLNQLLASIQKQVYEKCTKQIYLVVGIYEMSDESVGIMGALDRAIRAQRTVKDKGFYRENAVAVYDNKLREELQNRQYVEAHMMEALENDEFKVFYQPKVSIATGKIVGAEALVRWIRPNGEVISPSMFVPIFEQNGFITDMDFAIYRHAVSDIKRWLRNGYDVPLVSLNVSRHHLKDDNFAEKFTSLVDGLGVPHDKIELEVTESLLTDNLDKLVEVMSELKSSGFRISVDDFGSGYSSLNLITQLPFDTLKIDGGFFLKNDLTEKNKKVISSVVTLAKSLNLETVSEGVETQTQVDFLRDLGCNMIQGYFYYKPMPTGDFENLIAQKTEKV